MEMIQLWEYLKSFLMLVVRKKEGLIIGLARAHDARRGLEQE